MKWKKISIDGMPNEGVYLMYDEVSDEIRMCGVWKHLKPVVACIATEWPFNPTHYMELPKKP